MTETTPGQAAYVAYAARFTATDGDTSAVRWWDELPQRHRDAWDAAAEAASDEIAGRIDLEREAKIRHLKEQLAAVTADNERLKKEARAEIARLGDLLTKSATAKADYHDENERLKAGIIAFAAECDGDGYGDWGDTLRKLVTP